MTAAERRKIGSLGGKVTAEQSKSKAAALAALHAAQRGLRKNPDTRDRQTVLGDVQALLRAPVRGVVSGRALAGYCRVSDRTLRRWLSGEDWPPATQVRRMAEWTRHNRK